MPQSALERHKSKAIRQGEVIANVLDYLHWQIQERPLTHGETLIYDYLRFHLEDETERILKEIRKEREKCAPK